jgi:hypothetical protein
VSCSIETDLQTFTPTEKVTAKKINVRKHHCDRGIMALVKEPKTGEIIGDSLRLYSHGEKHRRVDFVDYEL